MIKKRILLFTVFSLMYLSGNCQSMADTVFTITARELILECITYHPLYNRLFLGSLYKNKINSYTISGHSSEFIRSNYEDLQAVVGIRVDTGNKFLWVLSLRRESNIPWKTAVFKF